MNRTRALLTLAGGLALLALVLSRADPAGRSGGREGPTEPNAAGARSLSTRRSQSAGREGRTELSLTATVEGRRLEGSRRRPVDLALVLDRSGSMAGQKLEPAKQAG